MAYSIRIGNIRLLEIEVYKNNELIYKGMSDDAPDDIKQLNWGRLDGSSPLKIYVE